MSIRAALILKLSPAVAVGAMALTNLIPLAPEAGVPEVAYRAMATAAASEVNTCGVPWYDLAGILKNESNYGNYPDYDNPGEFISEILPNGDVVDIDDHTKPGVLGPELMGRADRRRSRGLPWENGKNAPGGNKTPMPATAEEQALHGLGFWRQALGPFQIMPNELSKPASRPDIDGDGEFDVHNLYDAAGAALYHLCADKKYDDDGGQAKSYGDKAQTAACQRRVQGGPRWTAIRKYNGSGGNAHCYANMAIAIAERLKEIQPNPTGGLPPGGRAFLGKTSADGERQQPIGFKYQGALEWGYEKTVGSTLKTIGIANRGCPDGLVCKVSGRFDRTLRQWDEDNATRAGQYEDGETLLSPASSSNPATIQAIVDAAEAEHEWWAGRNEGNPAVRNRLRTYWAPTSLTLGGRWWHGYAWSAVFVSHTITEAGLDFPRTTSHSTYFTKVRDNPEKYDYIAMPGDTPLEIGDVLCYPRAETPRNRTWKTIRAGEETHCDIVVAKTADDVTVIGGNIGNTATRRDKPIDSTGAATGPHYGVMRPNVNGTDLR